MSELKNCPFCGKNVARILGVTNEYWVLCTCNASSGTKNEGKDAIDAWNRRPIEDALNKRIAELEAENAKLRAAMEGIASSPDSFASLDMFMKKIPINCKLKKIALEALKGGE